MSSSVSVLIVAKGEAPARLNRLMDAIAASDIAGIQVLLAAPADDLHAIEGLASRGAIAGITLIENPTGERSRGLNLCLAACTTEFICRLDARTVPAPDYLRRCVQRLSTSPSVAVVGGRHRTTKHG